LFAQKAQDQERREEKGEAYGEKEESEAQEENGTQK
jgi:hypothetical protein